MKRRVPKRDTMSIAGWLYADLFLGIAMLFFLFNTVGELPSTTIPTYTPTYTPTVPPSLTPTPKPTATATATSTPTLTVQPTVTLAPTATATPSRTPIPTIAGGLVPEPYTVVITVNMDQLLNDDIAELARVRDLILGELGQFSDQRAGIVLTFSTTLSGNPLKGDQLSGKVNALLRGTMRGTFGGAVFRDFHNLTQNSEEVGKVTLEIYWVLD